MGQRWPRGSCPVFPAQPPAPWLGIKGFFPPRVMLVLLLLRARRGTGRGGASAVGGANALGGEGVGGV